MKLLFTLFFIVNLTYAQEPYSKWIVRGGLGYNVLDLKNTHAYSYYGLTEEIQDYSSTKTGGAAGFSALADIGYRFNRSLNFGVHIDYLRVNEDAFQLYFSSTPTTFGMVSYGVFNEFYMGDYFALYTELNFIKDKQIIKAAHKRYGSKMGLGFHYSFKKAPMIGVKTMCFYLFSKLQGFEENAILYDNYFKRALGLEVSFTIDFGWYDPTEE